MSRDPHGKENYEAFVDSGELEQWNESEISMDDTRPIFLTNDSYLFPVELLMSTGRMLLLLLQRTSCFTQTEEETNDSYLFPVELAMSTGRMLLLLLLQRTSCFTQTEEEVKTNDSYLFPVELAMSTEECFFFFFFKELLASLKLKKR
ncbi:hypothetical protein JTE90_013615 [Oedothorax gibbosus]|uniref:Uncharacterized protein n=1 Tax=Oedothorax gibbosus TaxID=931172 RepID=A0AAV6URN5_9ARAC|nr:hypothetical protein JTE90_013615 [Oedothorax gibbosus]